MDTQEEIKEYDDSEPKFQSFVVEATELLNLVNNLDSTLKKVENDSLETTSPEIDRIITIVSVFMSSSI